MDTTLLATLAKFCIKNHTFLFDFFLFFFPLVFLWFILVSLTHCYEIIHLLWSHLHLIKPQPLQVGRAADMLNQAAYSCTHYFLWTHLHIIKPQSLLRLGAQLKGCVKLLIPASRRVLFPLF